MEPATLKEHITEGGHIPALLAALGCHSIAEHSAEYRAALPNHSNPTALSVHTQSLRVAVRNSQGQQYGDIFTLVMLLQRCGFGAAIRWLHSQLGLPYAPFSQQQKPKAHPLDIFRRITKARAVVNAELPVYGEGLIREYTPGLHISWVREGITPKAARRFNLGYSAGNSRIVIPERLWYGGDADYIGIMGRTTVPQYELLGIPKYYPLKPYPKGQNLYGLNENYAAIQATGCVAVFESQKSVLKRYSRLDETAVALGGATLTAQQARILIGLNVDIVLCLDQGVPLEHIRQQCRSLYPARRTYYIYDTWGLLNQKESPADKPDKIYRFLYKYKHLYSP